MYAPPKGLRKKKDAEAPKKYSFKTPRTRKCDTVKHNRQRKLKKAKAHKLTPESRSSHTPGAEARHIHHCHAPLSFSHTHIFSFSHSPLSRISLSLSLSQSPPLINLPTLLFRLIHNRRQKLLLIPRRRTRRQDIIFNTTRRQMIQNSMIRMNQHTTIILHRRRPIQNTLAQKPGQSRWRR